MLNGYWWNGGGGIKKRLTVNPGLRELLENKPDIFTFCELQISKSSAVFLNGYNFIFHRSYLKVNENYRKVW